MVKMEKCGHEGGDGDASAVHSGELKESAVLGCDEGLGVEDEKDDWVSVGIVRKRGHRQTCSNGSSLADSDFVSLPDDGEAGDLDVEENVSRRSTPTSGPGPGEFESDVPDWGPNPFVNHITIGSKTEAVKVVLMTLFVLPVRLIGITLFMFITWVLARLGVCGMTEMELKESPISGWRRDVRDVACIALRAMFLFGGFHWVTIKGKQASPKDAPILVVAPHSSFFDTLPVVVMGAPGLVAKGDIEKTFIFSSLLNFTQAIYVWREDPDSRLNTIKEIKRRMESSEPWPQLLIFPEGTCTNRQALITFKPGAFYPGLPVQPVCLRYPGERDYVSWTWKGATWFQAFWRTLTQFHTNCEIEFLPVYNPSETEKKDPVLFARNVRNVMARALEVPVVDYTFEDCRVMNAAEKCGLPCEVGLIQTYKLSRSLGMTTSDVIAEVRTFADFADMRTGLLSLDRFAKVLDLSLTPVEMMELLTLAGVPGHLDRLTFREYLMYKKQLMDLPRVDGKLKHLHGVLAKEVGGDSRIDGTSFRDLVDGESFSHLSVGDGAGDYDRFKASVIADSHLLDIIRGSISEQAGNTPSDR